MERRFSYLAVLILVLAAISGTAAFIASNMLENRPVEVTSEGEGETVSPAVTRRAEDIVSEMTLEEKVAQLFIIQPEALTGVAIQTAAGQATQSAINYLPVGGFIFFSDNLVDPAQTREMLTNMRTYSTERTGVPMFLCIDEEGGTVSRIASNTSFGVDNVGNMSDVGATGDSAYSRHIAEQIAAYVSELGFNVDFAPVADITDGSDSNVMRYRSFGSDANLVSDMVAAQVEAFNSRGVLCSPKHFPGIGDAQGDSHDESISTDATLDDMQAHSLLPFRAAIDAGAPMIMVGHLSCPAITQDSTPASLSYSVITGVLRDRLGYRGVVVTDALNMGAVSNLYPDDLIGVIVLEAGADLILMPDDFQACYEGILRAVESGRISEERIDESVVRIIEAKLNIS